LAIVTVFSAFGSFLSVSSSAASVFVPIGRKTASSALACSDGGRFPVAGG
jgi:hypothetical protein